jgi:protein HOOK3
MEESVQQVIMQSIQELDGSSMGCGATSIILGSGPETDPHMQRLLEEWEAAAEAREEIAQRCHELDMQVCTAMRNFLSALEAGVVSIYSHFNLRFKNNT